MSQALYRKYRPKDWSEVVGQEHIVRTLKNAIARDRIGHAYLFAGPRGTGKTTLARILAKAVNCQAEELENRPCNTCENCIAVNENRFLDLIEMDAASNTGVDDVRDLRDKIGFSPSKGRFKVYLVDEVHMLSTPAFNALLKTLEEPPAHSIFILATTEIHKIPATVLSRCQRHEFRRIPVQEILNNLQKIANSEGFQFDDEALWLVARQATGSIRDAQSLLDQLSSLGTRVTLELTQSMLGTAPSQAVLEVIESIYSNNSSNGLEALRRALDSGADPRTLARQIVDYLRSLMVIQMGDFDHLEGTKDARERMTVHAKAFILPEIIRLIRAFNHAAAETRGGLQPSLSLELAFAEAFNFDSAASAKIPDSENGSQAKSSRLQHRMSTDGSRAQSSAADDAGREYGGNSVRDIKTTKSARVISSSTLTSHAESPLGESMSNDSPPGTIELAQVSSAWKEVRAALKPSHRGVEALLNSCKPVEMQGEVLLLGFKSETVRALMDKPENLEAARTAIASVLGSAPRIKCVVINSRGKLPADLPTDGMVATALDHGGEIVDMHE